MLSPSCRCLCSTCRLLSLLVTCDKFELLSGGVRRPATTTAPPYRSRQTFSVALLLPTERAHQMDRDRDMNTEYRRKAVFAQHRRRSQSSFWKLQSGNSMQSQMKTVTRREHPLPVLRDALAATVVQTAKVLVTVPAPLGLPVILNHGEDLTQQRRTEMQSQCQQCARRSLVWARREPKEKAEQAQDQKAESQRKQNTGNQDDSGQSGGNGRQQEVTDFVLWCASE